VHVFVEPSVPGHHHFSNARHFRITAISTKHPSIVKHNYILCECRMHRRNHTWLRMHYNDTDTVVIVVGYRNMLGLFYNGIMLHLCGERSI